MKSAQGNGDTGQNELGEAEAFLNQQTPADDGVSFVRVLLSIRD